MSDHGLPLAQARIDFKRSETQQNTCHRMPLSLVHVVCGQRHRHRITQPGKGQHCVCARACVRGVGRVSVCWGGGGREAVCGVSVTCPGGVAWVACAALCVGGWGWGGGQVCGVGVLCIGATGGRVGGTGVRVWRAPAGAGGGRGKRRRPRDTGIHTNDCLHGCKAPLH